MTTLGDRTCNECIYNVSGYCHGLPPSFFNRGWERPSVGMYDLACSLYQTAVTTVHNQCSGCAYSAYDTQCHADPPIFTEDMFCERPQITGRSRACSKWADKFALVEPVHPSDDFSVSQQYVPQTDYVTEDSGGGRVVDLGDEEVSS